MRHYGGHFANRGHFLDVQHVIVRALQFSRLMIDSILECLGPSDDLFVRGMQLKAHSIERSCQLADFILGVNIDLVSKVARGEPFSSFFK